METFVEKRIFAPPLEDVYQPANEYPDRVGVGNVPYVESYVTDFEDCETLPPFALNTTVYEFAVQCA